MKPPKNDQNKKNRKTLSAIAGAVLLILIIISGRSSNIDWGTGWFRSAVTIVSALLMLWLIFSVFRGNKKD